MFFTEQKLQSRIGELKNYRYLKRSPIEGWYMKEDLSKVEKYPPSMDDSWEKIAVGSGWEGRDYYIWLQTEFLVPELQAGVDPVLLFDFGVTGDHHNSGFESLIFINDEPYQGVDSNHKEVFLKPEHGGKKIKLALKLWSGLEGGGPPQVQHHRLLYADYGILSIEVDDLYYTAKMMLDTVAILDENAPERQTMLSLVDAAFKEINWQAPASMEFYNSIATANDQLQKGVDSLEKNTPVTITAIGHTHIDVAWLWQLKHTREKSARSFLTVLRLMERYPEYMFLQSQPQLYAYIKEDYPEIYAQIKERIAEGKWEVDGAMWLESDCNIPSGESLVRQILYGTNFIKEEFNQDVNYLWLPDVFGYSWALPQILRKSGIDTFMTTKISWNQYNRMPHDTFRWRGIDGTEILTHYISTPDINNVNPYRYTYNGMIEAKSVKGIYDVYRDKAFNQDLLLAYGYGDGGGGVTRDMLEQRKRLDKLPGLPYIKPGIAKDYFERLHQTVETTDHYVHTWDGELYLEYHRGTYTSQVFVKKWNRKLELAYREGEILSAWAACLDPDCVYPKEDLDQGWEIILRNQFHDIIPGSSIYEVYEDAQLEYEQADALSEKVLTSFEARTVLEKEDHFTFFNSAGWEREDTVQILVKDSGYFVDEATGALPSVKTELGYEVRLPKLKALSSQTIQFIRAARLDEAETAFIVKENQVETPYYIIHWNKIGQLTKIFDKEYNRNVLTENGLGNALELFEDKPMEFDAWDIDLFHMEKKQLLAASKIEVLHVNEFSFSICFTYQFGTSEVTQNMILYTHTRRIDFKTSANWQERQQLLKAAFEVDIRSTEATYDIQFGHVKRPTHWNTSWDMARFETVGHQWVDFSERGYGVALLNDCKYGHSVKDQTISLSLLKGAIYPDPDADRGEHEFTYSLLPHGGDFIQEGIIQEAWHLNHPLRAYHGYLGEETFIKVEGSEAVMIDAIKKQESGTGIIIRLHEHTGSTRSVMLKPQFEFSSWQETDLMERALSDVNIQTSKTIVLELKPFEIKTVLIVP